MVALPQQIDQTLEAADRAMEARENAQPFRPYLGMSAIGAECARQLWCGFRWTTAKAFAADTLKRFADGHASEAVQADRLRAVAGLELWTTDPETGEQFGAEDFGGHFRGHCDGIIRGLLQAPKTVHIWEHKAVNEKGMAKLEKAKDTYGEKQALRQWNPVYWAQAQLYMFYWEIDRHYMTVSSPGCRRTISLRTEADSSAVLALREKARQVIFASRPPERISDDPGFYVCRWCDHSAVCHGQAFAQTHCRTCLHSTPTAEGTWHCERWAKTLSIEEQRAGCPAHLFIPDLVPGEQTDAGDDWVSYRMADGTEWRDGACS